MNDQVGRWTLPVLTAEQLDRMHAAAVRIVEEVGFHVGHEPFRREILQHAGVYEREGRVCVSAGLVERWLKAARSRVRTGTALPQRPYTLEVWDRALLLVERDNQTLRPIRREDVVWGTKLVAALGPRGITGNTCGVPRDLPVPLQPLEQFLIGAEFSPAGGSTTQVTDIPTAEVVREMDQVYGRPHARSIWLPSPLRVEGPEMDIFWHFRHQVEVLNVGTMPSMGITGPCDPISAYTLSVAETIGVAAMLHVLLPEVPVGICAHPQPADMTSGNLLFGSPEWHTLDMLHRYVFRYYGQEWDRKDILTSAALPGWQAQADRMTGFLLGMADDYHHFAAGGLLCLDEVWSPAQLMLDLDLLAQAQRIGRPVRSAEGLEPEKLPDMVRAALADPALFAVLPDTLANLRKEYPPQGLTRRPSRAEVQSGVARDALADAWAQADKLVAGYAYEAPAETLRELRRIYNWARERLR